MTDIQKRLQTIFQTRRVVFWYDDDAALKEEFEALELEDVEKRVIDNNEFSLKVEMLHTSPKRSFLLYAPFSMPKDEDNWLLDLNLANHMFSADRLSLILQGLGLDVTLKPFMQRFEKFLAAKARVQSLQKLLDEHEDERSIGLKLVAAALKCDDSVESILYKLFEDLKKMEILQKYELDSLLFDALKSRYNYSGDTIEDFLYKLLQNHFYHYVDKSRCPLNSEARLFVKNWMDSSRYAQTFKELSFKVANDLNIETLLHEQAIEKLYDCDTYEKCEQIIITHLLNRLENEKGLQQIQQLVLNRQKSFWYSEYKNIYAAIDNAAKLIEFVNDTDFMMKDFDTGIQNYTMHWYKADMYYRDYSYHCANAERLELLKTVSKKIEQLYLNGFLRELNDRWENVVQNYDVSTINKHQQNFFTQRVKPCIEKNKKLFVIVSDALRYECGVTLMQKVLEENKTKQRFSVNLKHMVSSLPSYTQLGMASLLPHDTLQIGDKNDTVYVDGISSAGTANRDKILKKNLQKSAAINYEQFIKMDKNSGREFAKEHQVIYIYHDEIDKMGEKNEPKTFDAVYATFDTLIKIMKQVANFNGVNMCITADHGFLFTALPTLESEFCSLDTKKAVKSNRRFVIGKELPTSSCVAKYEAKKLNIETQNEFLLAKSINKIRVQGAGNRFVHGGATLQEIVVPLLEVNITKNKASDAKEVNVEIVPISKISTNSVNVTLYQTQPVAQSLKPLRLKIRFESLDGVVLSDQVTQNFDSSDSYETNRQKKIRLTFKQIINEYNGKMIKLVARKVIESSSELPLYKEIEAKLSLMIMGDFDEF